MMKAKPRVSRTCGRICPSRRRSRKRSMRPADHRDGSGAQQCRHPEVEALPQHGHAEIGPQHEEGPVHQVRDAHQPEDQGKAGGEQEQEAAECHAVYRQGQPEGHSGDLCTGYSTRHPGRRAAGGAIRDLRKRVEARRDPGSERCSRAARNACPRPRSGASTGMTGGGVNSPGAWRADSRAHRPGWRGIPSRCRSRTGSHWGRS